MKHRCRGKTVNHSNAALIDALFPGAIYHVQATDYRSVLNSTFTDVVDKLHKTSELAAHIRLLPDYLVIHKSLPPERGTFFVRVFENKIELPVDELNLYREYFPLNRFLLLEAPTGKHLWLNQWPTSTRSSGMVSI